MTTGRINQVTSGKGTEGNSKELSSVSPHKSPKPDHG